MSTIISPSVLSADFLSLGEDIKMLNESDAGWIHIDVMDGRFVPNISYGFPIIKAIKSVATKPLDVHLMIEDANVYLEDFKNAGADIISVHYEACRHLHRTITRIKELGMKASVVLNPHTPINVLMEILPYCDMVLLMSVNPGYGGQKFISSSIQKVAKLNMVSKKLNPNLIIQVDGGVNAENAVDLVNAGAKSLVAGSFIFNNDNPKQIISELRAL